MFNQCLNVMFQLLDYNSVRQNVRQTNSLLVQTCGVLIVGVLLLSPSTARGAEKIKARIIANGDTQEVILHYKGIIKLQEKIVVMNNDGEKSIIRPDEIEELHFVDRGDSIIMRSIEHFKLIGYTGFRNKYSKILLKVMVDGELQLYYYLRSDYSFYLLGSELQPTAPGTPTYPVYKMGEDPIILTKVGFKEQMREYLKDCPDLVAKIEVGEYKKKDAVKIVEYYNEYCGLEE